MSLVYKLSVVWGDKENSLIIKGFIGNKEVASKEIGELRSMNKLEVTPDDLELSLDKTSYDATRIVVKLLDNLGEVLFLNNDFIEVEIDGPSRIVVKLLDNLGEVLFLNNDFIEVEIDGPLSIMGPSKFGISGGATDLWVRTQGQTGLCKIKVKSMYFEE